jgi:hypothetical protein
MPIAVVGGRNEMESQMRMQHQDIRRRLDWSIDIDSIASGPDGAPHGDSKGSVRS